MLNFVKISNTERERERERESERERDQKHKKNAVGSQTNPKLGKEKARKTLWGPKRTQSWEIRKQEKRCGVQKKIQRLKKSEATKRCKVSKNPNFEEVRSHKML